MLWKERFGRMEVCKYLPLLCAFIAKMMSFLTKIFIFVHSKHGKRMFFCLKFTQRKVPVKFGNFIKTMKVQYLSFHLRRKTRQPMGLLEIFKQTWIWAEDKEKITSRVLF